MANIKSAKKRILVINKKTARNKMIKSAVKTSIKKVIVAAKENNKPQAQAALVSAVRAIDKACSKGIYHKNNASRKKSRLYKLVNKIA
ncbi:MAG: 30S ribosomal protein S20 [Firmicutes bacterium]|nr:30S ribosomal protein S20 [Bacillota bacterium]